MTTTLNATTSNGLVATPDNSGAIALQNNGTTGLNLTAAGYPLTPLRPAFYARKTGSQTIPASTVITFDSAVTNIGSGYSTSTNRFTAPVSGMYSISAKTMINRNGLAYVSMSPYINGSGISGAGCYTDASGVSSGNLTYMLNFVYYLNATDYLEFKIECPSGNVVLDNSGYFCGFLIG